MVDINKPVVQGQDVVLNYGSGKVKLGSAGGYNREASRGLLYSLPPDDNPKGDVNPPDAYGTQLDLAPKPTKKLPKRDAKGHFVKS